MQAVARTEHGLLILRAKLPVPAWDKNSRIGWSRGGRRFLVPEARQYRAQVELIVRPALPRSPYFIGGQPWYVAAEQGEEGDVDHYLSGVMDDLCKAGLAKNDDDCTGILVLRIPGLKTLNIAAIQELPK